MAVSTHLERLSLLVTSLNILVVLCVSSLELKAQILTKDDLQREITTYEASAPSAASDLPALEAGRIWSHLGTLYQDAGLYTQAQLAFEHAMRLLTTPPVSKPDLAQAIDDLGTLYMEMGHTNEAEHAELKALRMREEVNLNSELPKSWYHLATLYLREHRSGKAREFADRSVTAFFADADASREDKIGSLLVLASALCQAHAYSEAITKLQSALQMTKEAYGTDKLPTGLSEFLLGYAEWKHGDLSSANQYMQRGTEVLGKEIGWRHPAYLSIMTQYARFLRAEHRQDLARDIDHQIKSMRAQLSANPASSSVLQAFDITTF